MKLSIIIINWNTAKLLKQCLESVVNDSIFDIKAEIIVVDNGSTDGSVEIVEKLIVQGSKCKIKMIKNQSNIGFAKAVNQGIGESNGKIIFILNSDTIIKENAIKNLVVFLDRNSNMAVSPLLLLPNNKVQNEYYMKSPNLWQVFLYHNPVLRPLVMKIPFLKQLVAQKISQTFFEADQLPGAGIMMRKEVWNQIGPLDENYHFLFEDVDWCWRAKEKGINLIVVPEAKIIHLGGASWRKKKKQDKNNFYYQFFCSMLFFVRKNYGKAKGQIFKWAIIVNFILTFKVKLAYDFYKNNGKQLDFL